MKLISRHGFMNFEGWQAMMNIFFPPKTHFADMMTKDNNKDSDEYKWEIQKDNEKSRD